MILLDEIKTLLNLCKDKLINFEQYPLTELEVI